MRTAWTLLAVAAASVFCLAAATPNPRGRGSRSRNDKFRRFEAPGNATAEDSKDAANKREGKFFPIFSVVQFKNLPCTSNAGTTGSGNQRNGTCYTEQECSDRAGSASGNCALGFGVCCVFQLTSTQDQVSQNCTYVQNPSFPAADTAATALTWTVNKCSDDVCFLRLDFETFDIQGIGGTNINDEGTCLDQFVVTTSTQQTIPTICGLNTGYHMYIDIGANSGDTASLAFTFQGTATSRTWDIKVTQVECSNPSSPRDTCLQYHTGVTGRIETFNYRATNDNHLNNQNYAVCIRPEKGFCCVQYMLCADQPAADAWSLDTQEAAYTGDACATTDHVIISQSAGECVRSATGGNASLKSRYCGSSLAYVGDQDQDAPVCDCTPPFYVGIFTNAFANQATTAATAAAAQMNTAFSKGVCLDYTQIPC